MSAQTSHGLFIAMRQQNLSAPDRDEPHFLIPLPYFGECGTPWMIFSRPYDEKDSALRQERWSQATRLGFHPIAAIDTTLVSVNSFEFKAVKALP